MKDKRFWFGIVVTVAWLAFAAYMLFAHERPGPLNAWGDFFAGFFAPLAFLWLVIGYLQQGEELKHSTDALRLQAEELRNSVEQQSQLVLVSREQMKQEYEAIQEERELRRDAARPRFVPQHSGTRSSGGTVTYKLKLVNVGNTATHFRMVFEPPLESPKNHNLALVSRNDIVSVDLQFASTDQSIAKISYIDADGLPGEVEFTVQVSGANRLVLGEVKRAA
ncbi:hypothetical protein [Lysobacter sp. F6437]|uniref:hypothetical protein n=1 Tax=Lysobacter sp. F6437 TaxID=3459296 RepID=UPI00403DB8CF